MKRPLYINRDQFVAGFRCGVINYEGDDCWGWQGYRLVIMEKLRTTELTLIRGGKNE